MVYKEKANEYGELAEECYETGRYNSAAGRYYYSLFLTAKEILESKNFKYRNFLKTSENLEPNQRRQREYSHNTIHIALVEVLHLNTDNFISMWEWVYSSRIKADYKNENISQENIDICREFYYTIRRRLDNEYIV